MKIPFIPPVEFVLSKIYNRPVAIWLKFTFDRFRRAFKREKPVVWSNCFIAQEFLYGLDVIPIFPEAIVGLYSYLGYGAKLTRVAETRYSPDICSFYKAGMGMIMENLLPKPDFVISTSYICNGAVKFFEIAARYYKCPFYLINIPYEKSDENIKFVLKRLKYIKKATGLKDEKLPQSIHFSNQARKYMEMINALRKKSPCPIHGDESLGYVLAMYFTSWGSKECVDFYKSLFEMLKKRRVKKERFRILWLHHVRPYYNNNIMDILFERKARVVMDESSYLWDELDENKPYETLAEKMFAHPYGSARKRVERIKKMAEDYHVDGAIHFSQWGCRQSTGSAFLVKQALKDMGIPTLMLNGDALDERGYEPEQIKTRLEAFIELLEDKT